MTDEEAVKQFEKRNYNLQQHPTGANPVYRYRHDSEIERGEVAASAIRERIERNKGCEYCTGWYLANGQTRAEDAGNGDYKFCPKCGRKL